MEGTEIIVWKDNKFSLSRRYNDLGYDEIKCGFAEWKISFSTDHGTFSHTIGGCLYDHYVRSSQSIVKTAIENLDGEKSLNLTRFFQNWNPNSEKYGTLWYADINWNFKTNTFEHGNNKAIDIIPAESNGTSFPFPIEGIKALLEDMTNLLKELNWVSS